MGQTETKLGTETVVRQAATDRETNERTNDFCFFN